MLVRVEELGRQTEGLGLVVSHRAVFEFHVHGVLLPNKGPGTILRSYFTEQPRADARHVE